jgi:hypothetical protein
LGDKIPAHSGYVNTCYALSNGFSFDFRINPRYKEDDIDPGHFKVGTIFHMSSSYALSLVTGSRKDENGLPAAFRLQLQLSHSADIPPSQAIPGNYPNDLIFLSEDNSLDWNNWHRVVVRWGTYATNAGTGSFNIDGIDKGTFAVSSGTIMPKTFIGKSDPSVLCFGNFYEGNNTTPNEQSRFFSTGPALRDGLSELFSNPLHTINEPNNYAFNHPLKAEVHQAFIRRYWMNDNVISSSMNTSYVDTTGYLNSVGNAFVNPKYENSNAFWAPMYFVDKTTIRRPMSIGNQPLEGGVFYTPAYQVAGITTTPFNFQMSYNVDGHYINLENFVRDFANNNSPRLHHLSGSPVPFNNASITPANEILYSSSRIRRRNLSILPCDDGNFFPNYDVLTKNSITTASYGDELHTGDYSKINLRGLLEDSRDSLIITAPDQDPFSDANVQQINATMGYSPKYPLANPTLSGKTNTAIGNCIGTVLGNTPFDVKRQVQMRVPTTIYQYTRDSSSNQVAFFNISNLYYGSRILPGTFQITDHSLTGSAGRISITLKDDGNGNIYRADSLTPSCIWNSIGNIFYNEGIVVIKSPHLYFFGKDQYEMSFKGEYQLHSSKYEILAPSGLINSSSNPTYSAFITSSSGEVISQSEIIKPSNDPLDTDPFVYISNINFHDKNLNIVAKATFAQPFMKRDGDKILVKVAFDF